MEWPVGDPVARRLLDAAQAARALAYAPYSRFAVGAALLSADGAVIAGCNVENASYGLTVCAERVAMQRAVAEGRLGRPGQSVIALAVLGAGPAPLTPCGACRQVLAEFAAPDCPVWCASTDGPAAEYRLAELLPVQFALR